MMMKVIILKSQDTNQPNYPEKIKKEEESVFSLGII